MREHIQHLANDFQGFSEQALAAMPALCLDQTWPSITLVDLLFALNRDQPINLEELPLFQGAAAYIADFIAGIWERLPGTPKVELSNDETGAIILSLLSHESLSEGSTVCLDITNLLQRALRGDFFPLRPFEAMEVRYRPSQAILPLITLGIASGLTRIVDTAWRDTTVHEQGPILHRVQDLLSLSMARWYASRFANEELGANPALYAAQLIVPPIGYDEQFPGFRAVAGLLKFLTAQNADSSAIRALCKNLATCPDEQISTIGLLVALAFEPAECNPQLAVLTEAKSDFLWQYRPALELARATLSIQRSWFDLVCEGQYAEADAILQTERALGFLPLWYLPPPCLERLELLGLFRCLLSGYSIDARKFVDRLQEGIGVWEPELALQGIRLDLLREDPDRARWEFERFEQHTPNPEGAIFQGMVHRVAAELALDANDRTLAQRHFKSALALFQPDSVDYLLVGLQVVLNLVAEQNYPSAQKVATSLVALHPTSVSASLALHELLLRLDKHEEAALELSRLVMLNPCDRRVFVRQLDLTLSAPSPT